MYAVHVDVSDVVRRARAVAAALNRVAVRRALGAPLARAVKAERAGHAYISRTGRLEAATTLNVVRATSNVTEMHVVLDTPYARFVYRKGLTIIDATLSEATAQIRENLITLRDAS